MEILLQCSYEMRYWRQMRRSVLTVLYSPSMISSLSVDLAVTFSLPGVPASNCSIWHTQMQKSHEKENPLCFCQAYSWEVKCRMQDGTVMNLVLDNWTQIKRLLNLVETMTFYRKQKQNSNISCKSKKNPKQTNKWKPFPTYLDWDISADELDAVLLHVLSCTVRHVLVKASQQDGSYHDGNIEAKTCQETTALQSHVRCPNHQGLPRTVGQREEVITGRQRQKGRLDSVEVNKNYTLYINYYSLKCSVVTELTL